MCACLAVLARGWIVFVVGLLSAMGWAGSLGQKADLTGQIVIFGIVTAAVAFSTVPALYIVQHLRGKPVPRLVEVLGWVAASAAIGLGFFALVFDPGDFPWSGGPVLLFGCALLGVILRNEMEFG
jgi:protein-S-isoprenylcysteine O-methyltransferase Ste14